MKMMANDDISKLKAAALYVLNKCGEMDFIHLFKILYFAERKHYAKYGKHLIKDNFCALERGPVPSFLYNALKITVGKTLESPSEELIDLSKAFLPGEAECYYFIRPNEKPDMDELSIADIRDLDESYDDNISVSSLLLSKKSHDTAWKKAWEKQHTSLIDSYDIALAGGAKKEFVKYIEEQESFDRFLA